MTFNDSKFKVLHYRFTRNNLAQGIYKSPSGEDIKEAPRLKDLCVIMSRSGKFNDQIERVVSKGRQMMG